MIEKPVPCHIIEKDVCEKGQPFRPHELSLRLAPRAVTDERTQPASPQLVAVVDMGASAIRLVVAEIAPNRRFGSSRKRRAACCSDATRSPRRDPIADRRCRARGARGLPARSWTATACVQHSRRGDERGPRGAQRRHVPRPDSRRTGIDFEIINEAEESRLVYLAVREALQRQPALRGAWTLLVEVGGGSTDLTLLRQGQPNRSGVYALGAIRMRQQLDLRRLTPRHAAGAAQALRSPTSSTTSGARFRCAASRTSSRSAATCASPPRRSCESESRRRRARGRARGVPGVLRRGRAARRGAAGRAVPAAGCRSRDAGAGAARLPRAAVETAARQLVVSDASLRAGLLLDLADAGRTAGRRGLRAAGAGQRRGARAEVPLRRAHGRHVAMLAMQLFDELPGRARPGRPRAAAAGGGGAAPRHRHLREPARPPQAHAVPAVGVADLRPVRRRDGDGREHRPLPPPRACRRTATCPTWRSTGRTGCIVNKLAAILRVANALDAEHLQKVTDCGCVRSDAAGCWRSRAPAT